MNPILKYLLIALVGISCSTRPMDRNLDPKNRDTNGEHDRDKEIPTSPIVSPESEPTKVTEVPTPLPAEATPVEAAPATVVDTPKVLVAEGDKSDEPKDQDEVIDGGITSTGFFRIGVDGARLPNADEGQNGIFIQEYWESGSLHYLIQNLSSKPVGVEIAVFQSIADGKMKRMSKAHAPIELGGQAVIDWDAKEIMPIACEVGKGMCLVRVKLSRDRLLGFLYSPLAPKTESKAILTVGELNIGGQSNYSILTEQDARSFEAGSRVQVRLVIPADIKMIEFKKPVKAGESSRKVSQDMEVVLVESADFKVEAKADVFRVRTGVSKKSVKSDRIVTLTLKAPALTKESLATVSGSMCSLMKQGACVSQWEFTRAMWVRPVQK